MHYWWTLLTRLDSGKLRRRKPLTELLFCNFVISFPTAKSFLQCIFTPKAIYIYITPDHRSRYKITLYLNSIRFHIWFTVLLNSDPEKKKLLHPKSIPTSQCYYCTLIFNNFEMFRKKLFEIKPQTGGVNA